MGKPQRDVAELARETRHTLALYALIVVIVEAGLITAAMMTEGLDRTLLIGGMLVVLLTVVIVAGVKFVKPSEGGTAGETHAPIHPLGSPDQLVDAEVARSWEGKWNCRWTYRARNGELRPWAHDQINVGRVNRADGTVEATGISASVRGVQYEISGRVEPDGHFAQLFYSSPPPRIRRTGLFIVRLTPAGHLSGWWLGVVPGIGDVGGGVECVRSEDDPGFELRDYSGEYSA